MVLDICKSPEAALEALEAALEAPEEALEAPEEASDSSEEVPEVPALPLDPVAFVPALEVASGAVLTSE
jgi:hypothetical protein